MGPRSGVVGTEKKLTKKHTPCGTLTGSKRPYEFTFYRSVYTGDSTKVGDCRPIADSVRLFISSPKRASWLLDNCREELLLLRVLFPCPGIAELSKIVSRDQSRRTHTQKRRGRPPCFKVGGGQLSGTNLN